MTPHPYTLPSTFRLPYLPPYHRIPCQIHAHSMPTPCPLHVHPGIDGNGCPQGVSDQCASLVTLWMNQSGSAAGLLSLYDFYSDVCLGAPNAAALHVAGAVPSPSISSSSSSFSSSSSSISSTNEGVCADPQTQRYLRQSTVRAAMHVRPEAAPWSPCSQSLNDAYSCPDTLVNVAPLYRALVPERRVLVYSGDVDGIVPTLASRRWIASIEGGLTQTHAWQPWLASDGQIGGWKLRWVPEEEGTEGREGRERRERRERRLGGEGGEGGVGGELVFATVRGAGHQVPAYQPMRAFELFETFLEASE